MPPTGSSRRCAASPRADARRSAPGAGCSATLNGWRSCGSAAWPSRTACSSTGRRPGAPQFASLTGRSRRPRVRSRRSARQLGPARPRPVAARRGIRRSPRHEAGAPRGATAVRASGRRRRARRRLDERKPRATLVAAGRPARGRGRPRIARPGTRRASRRAADVVSRGRARLDRHVRDRRAGAARSTSAAARTSSAR